MNGDVVRQLIRQRIHDGRLPRHRVIELGSVPDVGHQCDGSARPSKWISG